jgi:UDPglucose--hexose-1-phosphate uridylyltransferase
METLKPATAPTAPFRTTARLADGRELIYYDESPGLDRAAVDRRDLPVVATVSELRVDPLTEETTVVSGHRQERTFLPAADQCPLCPSAPDRPSEIPAGDYDVAVFENRFPSLAGASGRCEVVCFSSDHQASFGALPARRIRALVDVLADRTTELNARPGTEYVFCFENRGVEVGVTLHHPHGQIYGFGFVPPRVSRMLEVARTHRSRTGQCVACQALAAEKADGSRIVLSGEYFTAYIPHAARWPFDLHVVPHRHVPDLPALTSAERDDLAAVAREAVVRLDAVFDAPMPYIGSWYQAPARVDRDVSHLRWQLACLRRAPGKLKYLAGAESGAGAFMNDVVPEHAAALLRGEG